MHRTIRTITALAAATTVVAVAGCSDSGSGSEGLDAVTIQLDYQPRGLHSIFYVADELGYFEDAGIEISEILTGTSSGDTLRLVGTGQGDFGMADLPTLIVSQSEDVPVAALAAVNQTSPLAMCTVADEHPVETPADLEGLTVGVHSSGSTYVFYQALLAANGIDPSALTELSVTPPYENYLLTGQVDTVPCYTDAELTILEEHAGGEGSLDVLMGSDWGYEAYGTGVFTSDEMIESDPDLVQRFMDAYAQALDYVAEHPREAAEILAASSPDLADNIDLYETQIEADIETFTSDATEATGFGAMDEATWQAQIDLLAEQGVIESEPSVDDVQDSTFIDAANEG